MLPPPPEAMFLEARAVMVVLPIGRAELSMSNPYQPPPVSAPARLAYMGPAGTFGEEAARRFAPGADLISFPSHAAVASAVESGLAEMGVVAIENAINGSVAETLDILIHETTLQVDKESPRFFLDGI